MVGLLLVSSWEQTHPKEGIYGNPHFSRFSAFSHIGKLQEGFFLHLLTFRCLKLKIISIPTLRF